MNHKVYSHTITFPGSPILEGQPFDYDSPLHELQCLTCSGTGHIIGKLGPGNIITFPLPKCSECLGKKVPALPPCELGL